jgi:hypothetical protein
MAIANWTLASFCVFGVAACDYLGNRAAEEAVRTYGHNVDSGAYIELFGALFFVPAVLLFAIAGAAFWRSWRVRWILQAGAAAWLALPVIDFVWHW